MSAHDAQYADHAMSPYAPRPDPNRRQEAAERVAFDHFRTVSPEFNEWISEQDYRVDLALIVSNLIVGDAADMAEARRLASRVQDDFTQFVANATDYSSWPLERQMFREVERESA